MAGKRQAWTRKKLHRRRRRMEEEAAEDRRRSALLSRKTQRVNRRIEAMLKNCRES